MTFVPSRSSVEYKGHSSEVMSDALCMINEHGMNMYEINEHTSMRMNMYEINKHASMRMNMYNNQRTHSMRMYMYNNQRTRCL